MRKIALILSLLAIVLCQELVVENYTGDFETGNAFVKTYQRPEWNNNLDFAVFGWFKVNSAFPRNNWSTIFHLTSNDANFSDKYIYGDRVLTFFTINNVLYSPTYKSGYADYLESQQYFNDADVDKWNFFYVAYSSALQRRFSYFQLASTGVVTNVMDGIDHQTSPVYKIFVGENGYYKYFPGSIFRVMIQGGAGAYRESNFNELMVFNPNSLPVCATLYSGYGFTGKATSVCPNEANYDLTKILSIYIPTGGQPVKIYDSLNLPGNKVYFNRSVETFNLQSIDSLVQTDAIKIVKTQCLPKRV